MNWKKLTALVLSAALSLSLAAPAMAVERPADWTPADGARTGIQTEVSLEEYLAEGGQEWFLTGKTEYTIQGMLVSKDTPYENVLEGNSGVVTDDGVTVLLKGTVDELWPSNLEKVMGTYTKADGTELTAEDFAQKDTYIDLKTKATPDTNFAMFIPADIQVVVETAWGDILTANRPGVEHGEGDFLVSTVKDGQPDLSDVWVLNGAVFPNTYDTSRMNASAETPEETEPQVPAPWYAEAQSYVTEKGYMSTVDGVSFAAEATVTRATVFQTIWNMVGKPQVAQAADFTDVTADAWYADAAAWAKQADLAEGTAGAFQGDREITRAEVAAIFSRYAAFDGWIVDTTTSPALTAPDYDTVPAWAAVEVAECYKLGLMKGNETGAINPSALMTRAELATMLKSYDELVPIYLTRDVEIEVPEQGDIPAHTIPGVLTMPGAHEGETFPAVVMLHGTGSNKDEAGNGYLTAAPELALNGIASLRIDFMGNGESEADYKDYNYTSANLDAKAAADYLAEQAEIDGDKLAVMGWSQGGTNALLAAAAYPETFKAVVTWSGALDLTTMFEDFDAAYATAKKDGTFEMTFDWRDSLGVGERWFKEVKETDVLKTVKGLEAPVLAINGDKDDVVLPENADKIAAAVQNGRVYLVEGADHTYNVFAEENFETIYKVADITAGFLAEKLNGCVTGKVNAVSKYGNVGTDIYADVFAGAGYAVGDVLKVTVGEQTVEAPFGTGYSNVDTGNAIVLTDTSTDTIAAAINMGNFSKTYGAEVDTVISFAMGEKEGYLEEYTIRNIDALRTNDIKDYDNDKAVFANFRAVKMGDIAEGVLYRASSPVNPELGRNTYVDAFIKEAKVKTILDLADSEEEYNGYEGVKDSYAATTNTVKLDMGVDFAAEDFTAKLKTGLEYMLANEGPYLIHCNEGKDRAGFVTMLLECLMGGTVREITEDYMLSYENYYHVEKDSDRWNRIAQSNVVANLLKLTGAEDEKALAKADLSKAAETYLTETVGLTAEQVTALKDVLAGK